MDYEYDAFFSYKRDRESDDWHKVVKEKLAFWVGTELGLEVKIFFDTEDIRTGARWRQKLANALKKSRCLICVWSPLYFRSKWCLSEFKSFLKREELNKRDLVMPASYCDGESFPPEAQSRQILKFDEFTSTMPMFWKTDSAFYFERDLLKKFAKDLAEMIRQSPPYDEAFPIIEASDQEVCPEQTIGRVANA